MSTMTRSEKMELKTVVKHYGVALTSEGFAPTTIATNQSVRPSLLKRSPI